MMPQMQHSEQIKQQTWQLARMDYGTTDKMKCVDPRIVGIIYFSYALKPQLCQLFKENCEIVKSHDDTR